MPKGKYKKAKKHKRHSLKLYKDVPNTKAKFTCDLLYSIDINQRQGAGINYPQVTLPLNFPNIATIDNGNGLGNRAVISGSVTNQVTPLYNALLNRFDDNAGASSQANPLFDTFRVIKLTARYVPNTFDVNINVSTGSTAPNFAPVIYHFNDVDDDTKVPNSIQGVNDLLAAGVLPLSYNQTNKKGLTFVFKQPKMNRKIWLNTTLIQNNVVNKVPTDPMTYGSGAFPNPYGSMKLLWEVAGLATGGLSLGRLYVTWRVQFKGIPSLLH